MEWEAGDVKRGRVAGVAQGRGKGNVSGRLDSMKAGGTPDRRLRANRVRHGSGGGGGMPPPPPHPPPRGRCEAAEGSDVEMADASAGSVQRC